MTKLFFKSYVTLKINEMLLFRLEEAEATPEETLGAVATEADVKTADSLPDQLISSLSS